MDNNTTSTMNSHQDIPGLDHQRTSNPSPPPSVTPIAPQILSVPNPKRATSIDFLRFEHHVNNSVLNGSPHQHSDDHHFVDNSINNNNHHSLYESHHHNTNTSFSSANTTTLGLGDSLFHPFAATSIGVIGEKKTPPPMSNNAELLHPLGWKSPSEDLLRHLTPPPGSNNNGNGLSSWTNSTNDLSSLTHSNSFIGSSDAGSNSAALFDDSKWAFAERPPGLLMNRAASAIGFGSNNNNNLQQGGSTMNNALVGNLISRPVSTPIYPTNSLLGHQNTHHGLGFNHTNDDMFASFGLGGNNNSLGLGNANNFDNLLSSMNIRSPTNGMDNSMHNMHAAFSGMSNTLGGGLGGNNPNNSLYMNHNLRNGNKQMVGGNVHNSNAFNNNMLGGNKDEVHAWPKPVRGYPQHPQHQHGQYHHHQAAGLDVFSNNNIGRIASPNNHNSNMHHDVHMGGRRSAHSTTPSKQSHHNNSNNNINRTMSPKISIQNLDERAIENVIATNCYHILIDAADHSLKAVELANTLRARVGTEVLAVVRERWGGLLSLLERHTERFLVERIPKNDRVSLKMKDESSNNNITSSTTAAVNTGMAGADSGHTGLLSANNNTAAAADSLSSNAVKLEGGTESNNNEDEEHNLSFHDDSLLSAAMQLDNVGEDGERSLSNDKDPFNSMFSNSMQHSGGYSFDPQNQLQATRCLHVGNVPSSYTEMQLVREFEKFGHIDGLKLISQKNGNRRFAFVTFKTVAQAVTARHCLSKIHPWKSAISFAHKEWVNKVMHGSGLLNVGGTTSPQPYLTNIGGNGSSGNNKPGLHSNGIMMQQPGSSNIFHGLTPASPDRVASPQPLSGAALGLLSSVPSYSSIVEGNNNNSVINSSGSNVFPDGNNNKPASPAPQQGQPLPSHNNNNNAYRNMHSTTPVQGNNHHHLYLGNNASSGREQVVLQRLCDDTYVPTQPWPVDTDVDLPFCRAVVDQIAQFGGSTTVSKLRGFLKHRVGTIDNIKSVPLKAMLTAYPTMFKVEGNFVSLVSSAATNHVSHHSNPSSS